uniref:Uncharacterized protein n=1 Tax=Avena sativa TaxID=4498 RepID=A0ACD6A6J6_AVESA
MASSSSATSGGDRPPSGGGGTLPSQAHAEWAASMQAYYAAAAAGHPYAAWAAQQQHGLVAAGPGAVYGAAVPFHLYYAHASMAAGMPYPAVEASSAATEGKRKTRRVTSGEGASSSGSGDAGSQGSSEKGDAAAGQKGSSSTKRIKSGSASTEGEPSQAASAQNAVTEPPSVGKGRSASKLSVSAPGRATLPNAAPTLNIGMDPWSTSPSAVTPSGQGEVNAAASSQSNGSLSLMDERELKRERRKQSNRDSARRSRLRKQQECEELAQKVSDLTACNGTLRSELDQLKKDCKAMEAENKQLTDEMLRRDDKVLQSEGRSVITTLSIQVEESKAHHSGNGKASEEHK